MKKSTFKVLSMSLLISFAFVDSHAQGRSKNEKVKYRFNTGLVLGINFSQIDGDYFHGYNKKGIRAGLKSMYYVDEKIDLTTGVYFVQRGSRFAGSNANKSVPITERRIHLDYIEIPFSLTFKSHKEHGGMIRIDLGGSFSRLFNSQVTEVIRPFSNEISYASYEEQFRKNEINFIAAIDYFFLRKLGIGIQYTHQLNQLYHDPNFVLEDGSIIKLTKELKYLRNFQFGLQLTYHLN